MPKKHILLGTLIFITSFILSSQSVAATDVNARMSCKDAPLMQKQVTASYPQSSYSVCKIDKEKCAKFLAQEPQTAIQVKKEQPKEATASVKKAEATPSPSPLPLPTPVAIATGSARLNADVLFEMINTHRRAKDLPAFEKEERLCQLAQSRGPELDNEIYGDGYIHQGFRERNLPYWITENMISKETEEIAFRWWLNSSLHRSAIEGDKKYACGICQGRSCAMLFTSWEEK